MGSRLCGSGDSEVDKNKIVRGFVTAGGAIFSIVLSAFGVNRINKDNRRDGLQGDSGQEDSYPEELFEKYKYK